MYNPVPRCRLALTLVALLLASCADNNTSEISRDPNAKPSLSTAGSDEAVIAKVNGSAITQADLDVYLARTLGTGSDMMLDDNVQSRVLESLVSSRAIAQQSLAEMSADDVGMLEKRVAQFREELLVKRYLLEHAEANTVSAEQIKAYYEENQSEFSGSREVRYEFLTVAKSEYDKDPGKVVERLSLAKNAPDWQSLILSDADGMTGVMRNVLALDEQAASTALEKAVVELREGQTSRIIMQSGSAYIARVVSVTEKPGLSLENARHSIARKLLPLSVKQSVRDISAAVLKDSKVEYF